MTLKTQEELAKKLEESGFAVNAGDDFEGYPPAEAHKSTKRERRKPLCCFAECTVLRWGSRYARVLKDAFISVDLAKNILVIKTRIRHGNGGSSGFR